jgi:Rrf2 family protein
MLYLATQPPNRPTFQRDISETLNIPPHFLGKILQQLSRSQLVISQKGKSGGFALAKSAHEITPYDIIEAIDGEFFLDGCYLGFPGCDEDQPCPVHSQWKELKADLILMLQGKNIAELGAELDTKVDSTKRM